MAQITINEISQNYTFNVGDAQYATVAMPITAAWGPAYLDPATLTDAGAGDAAIDAMLDQTKWLHFPSNQAGMESFMATFRGPASNWKVTKDYSYQQAVTLLAAGYDLLVCRVCSGAKAQGNFTVSSTPAFTVKAKYAGTFGNNLRADLVQITNPLIADKYWSLVIYAVNDDGSMTSLENILFCFDLTNHNYTDGNIPHITEVESNYVDLINLTATDTTTFDTTDGSVTTTLTGGSDTFNLDPTSVPHTVAGDPAVTTWYTSIELSSAPADWSTTYTTYFVLTQDPTTKVWSATTAPETFAAGTYYQVSTEQAATAEAWIAKAKDLVAIRYNIANADSVSTPEGFNKGVPKNTQRNQTYYKAWSSATTDLALLSGLVNLEWCYNAAFLVYQLLKDKLNYNPQRIISPGWDDQNIYAVTGNVKTFDVTTNLLDEISPLHQAIMDAAFWGRCATGFIDIPKACPRNLVWNPATDHAGYAQLLARFDVTSSMLLSSNGNAALYTTHYALFAPWGQYIYSGTAKMATASPSFLALMIQRAQILNQSSQYEWLLPENRKHNLKIGKMDYEVPDKLRQQWQSQSGARVNIITYIPDYNINLWGNSTCFEVPPATYQALANLSTRYLFNAIENQVYKIGISLTWYYTNEQSIGKFYAGCRPLLDQMRQLGAIEDYRIEMSVDINGEDHINANSLIGKIYITPYGCVEQITVDLIALPQGTSLAGFGE